MRAAGEKRCLVMHDPHTIDAQHARRTLRPQRPHPAKWQQAAGCCGDGAAAITPNRGGRRAGARPAGAEGLLTAHGSRRPHVRETGALPLPRTCREPRSARPGRRPRRRWDGWRMPSSDRFPGEGAADEIPTGCSLHERHLFGICSVPVRYVLTLRASSGSAPGMSGDAKDPGQRQHDALDPRQGGRRRRVAIRSSGDSRPGGKATPGWPCPTVRIRSPQRRPRRPGPVRSGDRPPPRSLCIGPLLEKFPRGCHASAPPVHR